MCRVPGLERMFNDFILLTQTSFSVDDFNSLPFCYPTVKKIIVYLFQLIGRVTG